MNDITKRSIENAIVSRECEMEEIEEHIYRIGNQLERHTKRKEDLLAEIKALENDLNK